MKDSKTALQAALLPASDISINSVTVRFIEALNHETRTHLNGIMGFSETLLAKTKDKVQQKLLSDIHQCGGHILLIVEELTKILTKKTVKTAKPQKAKISKKHRPKVLLVEDHPIVQMASTAILEQAGCTVELAKNGRQALEMASKGYDIIFMDVGLPDISGIEVTKEIRRREGNMTHTPIVALTALNEKNTLEACIIAGMDRTEIKPIANERLKELLIAYT